MATYQNKNEIILPSPRVVFRFRFTVSGSQIRILVSWQILFRYLVQGFQDRLQVTAHGAAERSEACIASRIAYKPNTVVYR